MPLPSKTSPALLKRLDADGLELLHHPGIKGKKLCTLDELFGEPKQEVPAPKRNDDRSFSITTEE